MNMRTVMYWNPGPSSQWRPMEAKLRHQCPWCGTDSREGEHAIQSDRPDGGVNVSCKVVMYVRYPARVFRMEGVTGDAKA